MDDISQLLPALWGAAGAFIYAGPRWVACLIAARETKRFGWACFAEFVVAIIVGAISAAAFSAVALRLTDVRDGNAIAAMIGLLANPLTPAVIKKATDVAGNTLGNRVGRAIGGDQ